MRVLLIDETVHQQAEKLKEFATAHRQNIHEIMRRMSRPEEAAGNDANYVMEIMDGWRIVYTVEQHPGGWFHHISISVDPVSKEKPWPSIEGVNAILKLFRLENIIYAAHVWQEDTTERKAINILFTFKEQQ